jgi:hypothetical protein
VDIESCSGPRSRRGTRDLDIPVRLCVYNAYE